MPAVDEGHWPFVTFQAVCLSCCADFLILINLLSLHQKQPKYFTHCTHNNIGPPLSFPCSSCWRISLWKQWKMLIILGAGILAMVSNLSAGKKMLEEQSKEVLVQVRNIEQKGQNLQVSWVNGDMNKLRKKACDIELLLIQTRAYICIKTPKF